MTKSTPPKFGTNAEPNLERLAARVQDRLESRVASGEFGGFSFGPLRDFKFIENKPYRAVAAVDAYHTSRRPEPLPSKLYVIVFAPGDGTGNRTDFPSEFPDLPAGHTPRRKPAQGAEVLFPIGTAFGNHWGDGIVNLTEITADWDAQGWHTERTEGVPVNNALYHNTLCRMRIHNNGLDVRLRRAHFTQDPETGYGNAHAVVFERRPYLKHEAEPNRTWLQVAAFLQLPLEREILDDARSLTDTKAFHRTMS